MPALDHLLARTESNLNLGQALSQSIQDGAQLGQSFRAQDAALLAAAAEQRAQNAAAFETSVRAGRAFGEAKERQFNQELAVRQADTSERAIAVQEEQNRQRLMQSDYQFGQTNQLARDQFQFNQNQAAREDQRYLEEQRRRNAFLDGNIPMLNTQFDFTGDFSHLDEQGLPAFDVQDFDGFGGGDPSGGIKMTNYGYANDTTPDTNSNVLKKGNRNNRLVPGVSVALTQDYANYIGAQLGDAIEFTDANGQTRVGVYDDTSGTHPIDWYRPSAGSNKWSGHAVSARVVGRPEGRGKGFIGQGEQSLRTFMAATGRAPSEDIVEPGAQGPNLPGTPQGPLQPVNLQGGDTAEDPAPRDAGDGTKPGDAYYDQAYLEELDVFEREPYIKAANQELRELPHRGGR